MCDHGGVCAMSIFLRCGVQLDSLPSISSSLLLLLLGIVVDDEVVRFGVGEEEDDDGEVVEV